MLSLYPILKPISNYIVIYNLLDRNNTVLLKGILAPLAFTAMMSGVSYYVNREFKRASENVNIASSKLGLSELDQAKVWNEFQTNIPNFFGYMLLRSGERILTESITSLGHRYLFKCIEKKLIDKVFDDRSILFIAQDTKKANSMVFISNDIYWACYNSSTTLSKAIVSTVHASIGLYTLYNAYKSGEFKASYLLAPLLINISQQVFTYFIVQKKVGIEIKAREKAELYRAKQSDALQNANDLLTSDALPKVKDSIACDREEIDKLNTKQTLYDILGDIFNETNSSCSELVSFWNFGKLLYNRIITHEQKFKIDSALENIIEFLISGAEQAEYIENARCSLKNVESIFKLVESIPKTDNQNRTFSGDKLKFDNYKIHFKDKFSLHLNGELEKGAICLIKAPSGAGKSTLISQIYGLAHGDHFTAEGKIILPKSAKLAFVSQNSYAPLYWTLKEIILMGIDRDVSNDELEKLLSDFKLDDLKSRLNETISFANDDISGGQKKRIKIINAILKQPNVLILDEVFNGLDPETAILCRNKIKEHCKDAITLSISHEEKAQECDFYDHILEIKNDKNGNINTQDVSIAEIQR